MFWKKKKSALSIHNQEAIITSILKVTDEIQKFKQDKAIFEKTHTENANQSYYILKTESDIYSVDDIIDKGLNHTLIPIEKDTRFSIIEYYGYRIYQCRETIKDLIAQYAKEGID